MQTYSDVLRKHQERKGREERRKTNISEVYTNFSNGKVTKNEAILNLAGWGVGKEEASDNLDKIQKALDDLK